VEYSGGLQGGEAGTGELKDMSGWRNYLGGLQGGEAEIAVGRPGRRSENVSVRLGASRAGIRGEYLGRCNS